MALNGINAPLAMIGQDAVWLDVFVNDFGLDQDELLESFFAAPTYQPWHWMGNLNGYAVSSGTILVERSTERVVILVCLE